MKNNFRKFLTLITTVIILISCGELITDPKDNGGGIPPQDDNGLNNDNSLNNKNISWLKNKWENPSYSGEIYEYDGENFTSFFGDSVSYAVKIEKIKWTSDIAGIMYGKYTSHYENDKIGKYYAVSFKDLTDSSISISGAWNRDTGVYATDTLKEAEDIFTVANGSFAQYSDCNQIKAYAIVLLKFLKVA